MMCIEKRIFLQNGIFMLKAEIFQAEITDNIRPTYEKIFNDMRLGSSVAFNTGMPQSGT